MSARQCECDPKNAHIDRFWIKPYCSGVYSSVVSRPSLRLSPVCCLPRPYPCRERGARAATQRMRWGARRARAPGRTRHSATPGARGPRAWPGHGPRAGCTRGARGVCVLLVSRSSRPSSKILRKTTTKSHRTRRAIVLCIKSNQLLRGWGWANFGIFPCRATTRAGRVGRLSPPINWRRRRHV